MPKIPLKSLGDWQFSDNPYVNGQRSGITAEGRTLLLRIQYSKIVFSPYWYLDTEKGTYHREYAQTSAAAQDAADCYLAEHFELPVSVEDELAAAKKRIAELEAQAIFIKPYYPWFSPGQRVHIKGASKEASIPVTCIRLYDGDTVFSLANGQSYHSHELEPA